MSHVNDCHPSTELIVNTMMEKSIQWNEQTMHSRVTDMERSMFHKRMKIAHAHTNRL